LLRNKLIWKIIPIIINLCFVSIALTEENKSEFNGELSLGYLSSYSIDDTSGTPMKYGKNVLATIVRISNHTEGNPLSAYVKFKDNCNPDGGCNSDSADEIDYTVGVKYRWMNKATLDANYTYVNYHSLGNTRGDANMFNQSIETYYATGLMAALRPFMKTNEFVPIDGNGDGGFQYFAGLKPRMDTKIPLNIKMYIMGHDGIYNTRPCWVSTGTMQIATRIEQYGIAVVPEIDFQEGLINKGRGLSNSKVYGGFTMTYSF